MTSGRLLLTLLLASCTAPATPIASPPAQPANVAEPAGKQHPVDLTPPTFRLPGDVKPESYGLELTILPASDHVDGQIRIAANVVRSTSVIWLNARGLTVSTATAGDHDLRVIPGGEQFVGLVADRALPVGPVAIAVNFRAPIDRERSQGIYSAKEGTEPYVYTFFEPIDSRRAFPSFDEPSYKVPWQLTFHIKKEHIARGNAPVVKETDEANGMKRVELAPTKPIPSYLVAFMVGPFDDIDDGVAGRVKTPIHFILPKGRADELDYAKQITPKIVVALENYFDMDYPYGKLDVAVVPRYWGTMEHPGIVAMGQPLTLIRKDQRTHERESGYANIVAHELSHYWFGDVVTLAWWDDTWLNEALGEFEDMIITDAVEPSWHHREYRAPFANSAMVGDEVLASRAMHQNVTTNEGIQASFDNDTTYFKGSTVMRQLEHFVGEQSWQKFIRGYIRKHEWGNATEKDFVDEMRAALGDEAASGFQQYVTRPGVPLAHVHAECKGSNQLVLDPMPRALPAGVEALANDQQLFTVPICVRYGDAKHSEHACSSGPAIATAFCPTWIISNDGGFGYYRSVLDVKTAKDLLDPASKIAQIAKPGRSEKLMLIYDLTAMLKRDQLSLDQALPVVELLIRDPDPAVAEHAMALAPHPANIADEALAKTIRAWIVKNELPTARALTWQKKPSDSFERNELRAAVLGIARWDPALRGQAIKLSDKWLVDRTGISDDLVDTALSATAYTGDAEHFEAILAAAKKPRDRTEVGRLLVALGNFTDPKLAERARDIVYGTELDLRDSLGILYVQLGTPETWTAALDSLENHIDELLARMRSDESAWFLGAIAHSFCDAPHRDRVAKLLVERSKKIDGAQVTVSRGLEQSDQCIAEVAREMPALLRFFKK
jgi:aminopeptidase N